MSYHFQLKSLFSSTQEVKGKKGLISHAAVVFRNYLNQTVHQKDIVDKRHVDLSMHKLALYYK